MECKIVYVFLADNEWGSPLMDKIAQETFADYPEADLVEVHEHAGWWLAYNRDGRVVETANDMAVMSAEVRQWWKQWTTSRVLDNFRRGEVPNSRLEREGVLA